jgi:acetyl-CoA acetyltransferase
VADAGLQVDQIDGISNYPNPSRPMSHEPVDGVDIVGVNYLSQVLSLQNLRWSSSLTGGTVTASMVEAIHALMAGSCDYALVWRAMHNPGGPTGRVSRPRASGEIQFTAPWGFGHTTIAFALPYSRYMAKYGATREHLATFAVRNRANAALNPDAVFYEQPITREDYMNARMIAEPLSILDCDMLVDGCGAIVLTTADRAQHLRQPPVFVRGYASLGLPPRRSLVLTLEDFMVGCGRLASALWKSARMTIDDITHMHVYDGFSYFPYLWLEAFGAYPEGEACRGIQDSRTSRQGKLPLNTNGGALGMGRMHGTPQVIEAVLQIRRGAGARQIANPSTALVQTGGPTQMCGALVLSESNA